MSVDPRTADELLDPARVAIERATEGDTSAAVDAMRLFALHVEDLTAMFLDRIEHDPYPVASDEGLAAGWKLAEALRYMRSTELADQADARLGYISDAAGSRDVRMLRDPETMLGA